MEHDCIASAVVAFLTEFTPEVGLLSAVARLDRNSSACRTPGAQTIFGFAFVSILAPPSVIPSLGVFLSEEAVGGILKTSLPTVRSASTNQDDDTDKDKDTDAERCGYGFRGHVGFTSVPHAWRLPVPSFQSCIRWLASAVVTARWFPVVIMFRRMVCLAFSWLELLALQPLRAVDHRELLHCRPCGAPRPGCHTCTHNLGANPSRFFRSSLRRHQQDLTPRQFPQEAHASLGQRSNTCKSCLSPTKLRTPR